MIQPVSRYVLRFAVFLLTLTASSIFTGSLFACVAVGQPQAVLGAAFFLALFALTNLWLYLLVFSLWLACFPPHHAMSWAVLLLFALAAGLAASWHFQTVRPWDFYHEADGSMPGWEPVHMVSLTSFISCLSAVASVALSAHLARRFLPIHHAA